MPTPATTTASPDVVPGTQVDLAISILTILSTLCATSNTQRHQSPECRQAEKDLLMLVAGKGDHPWVVRGSDDIRKTALERGLMAYIDKANVDKHVFGMSRSSVYSQEGVNWSVFLKGLQGLFSMANKISDPLDLVEDLKGYLIKQKDISSESLKVFMDLHNANGLAKVLYALKEMKILVVCAAVTLLILLVLIFVVWCCMTRRSYREERRARKEQKSNHQANIMMRQMAGHRERQLRQQQSLL